MTEKCENKVVASLLVKTKVNNISILYVMITIL